ncbi:unnamed protein product [Euphydryas editha]|uniref:Uncharacterized protein n=1 Tax=Euphydryas editha TaxID=104508 RepID=A0AAU9UAU8_EUPED|nr:unnamed protein product [Euphydryas editha]
MWTGILNGKIIEPFELPEALTGEAYLHFLQNELPNLLEDVPLETVRNMWMGRAGAITWPALSPDLSPLDLFYWSAIKEKVYGKPIRDLAHLKVRITEAAESINNRRIARHISR